MFALPSDIGTGKPQVTALVCPDCPGTLTVETRGYKGHLHFACRIGHTFAVPDLLAAKEQRIEERLWGAVLALEEMGALLRDLDGQAARECGAEVGRACQNRRQVVEAHARSLRALIDGDQPLDLGRGLEGSAESVDDGNPA
jgi:hypothetical protein